MKLGGTKPSNGGFTIVESMIVLSITAALGVSIFALISNRQQATEFRVGANALKQQMQQVLNETSSGYFPAGNVRCSISAISGRVDLSNGPGAQQGSNTGCIFLGKVLQFRVFGQPNSYLTYAIAGRQLTSGQQTTNLPDADPIAVAPGQVTNASLNGTAVTTAFQYGFQPRTITYTSAVNGSTNNPAGAFGYLSELATNDADGYAESGSQNFRLYGIKNSMKLDGTPLSSQEQVENLDTPLAAKYEKATQIDICLENGTPNHSALMQIGNSKNRGQATVTLDIRTDRGC